MFEIKSARNITFFRRRRAAYLLFVAFITIMASIFFSGCHPGLKKEKLPKARIEATESELVEILKKNKEALKSIRASIEVKVRTPITKGEQHLEDGNLAIGKPERFRMLAEKLLAAKFDIVSDGKIFWIYVKAFDQEKLYTGDVGATT